MIARFLLTLLLLVGVTAPARADDIAAAGRSVVRVVTIAVVDGQVVGFGHGSGVAVAPNRIVTNAHVTELADRYPDNVIIGIVPSEGSKSYQGKVVGYDSQRDLALIEFRGTALPAAALYTGAVGEGDPVVALGYPGNVDLATARSAADYITPTSPVRSQGVFSGRRTLTGIQVLLHTASIARGNSGGPLLDRCGRVIGINSAITRAEDGDSTFGFAIADTELIAFLREAKQPVATIGSPCTSIEERLRLDGEAEARGKAEALTASRDAATRAAMSREEAAAKASVEATYRRENVMGLAGLVLVLGALGIAAAGFLMLRDRRRPARWALGIGLMAMAAGIEVFLARPSPDLASADVAIVPQVPPPGRALGRLACVFQPDRSRVTVSTTQDVALNWGRGGCADGRRQYVEQAGRWERIVLPDAEQVASRLSFDPVTRTYADTRYLLSATAMDTLRKLRTDAASACTPDTGATDRLAQQEAAIRAVLPPLPNEKLVYSCAPAR